ncbi:MAG TPA: lytic transglycosylase domain-containing protein, partial [Longimicrobiaceae bacterium]|nr:lytic transglycosylase domain-containing protein [Longimicrobiaceae bacterium]
MQLRSALPTAVLLGGVIGAALVAKGSPNATHPSLNLIAEAEAATSATWDIPMVRNASVERFVEMFQGKQQDRMAMYLKRSGRYEGMIRAKLRARGMPEDLVYLSMIESGFNPTARSRAQAVGLWQFMEGTGRGYGLRVDGWVDERRDPERSTDAALRYLKELHGTFGSWYLAAAAYNSGDNRVKKVMLEETGSEKGNDADFWRIRFRLPAETREYVPLILAAALVGKEPGKYGLGEVPRWLPLETDTVSVPGGMPLDAVGRSIGVDGSELAKLNPALVRRMTPPGSKPFAVRIPQGRAEK